jgi:hypothetical protein
LAGADADDADGRASVFSGAEWLGLIFGVTAALYGEITLKGGEITAFRRVSLPA